ncbi:4590_t:CDS:1, partial [Racocetra persica]
SNQQEEIVNILKCLFEGLVKTYKEFESRSCRTNELQRWQDTNSLSVARKFAYYYNYIPEFA